MRHVVPLADSVVPSTPSCAPLGINLQSQHHWVKAVIGLPTEPPSLRLDSSAIYFFLIWARPPSRDDW